MCILDSGTTGTLLKMKAGIEVTQWRPGALNSSIQYLSLLQLHVSWPGFFPLSHWKKKKKKKKNESIKMMYDDIRQHSEGQKKGKLSKKHNLADKAVLY